MTAPALRRRHHLLADGPRPHPAQPVELGQVLRCPCRTPGRERAERGVRLLRGRTGDSRDVDHGPHSRGCPATRAGRGSRDSPWAPAPTPADRGVWSGTRSRGYRRGTEPFEPAENPRRARRGRGTEDTGRFRPARRPTRAGGPTSSPSWTRAPSRGPGRATTAGTPMSDTPPSTPSTPSTMNCAHCGWEVNVRPDGSYVCPQCFHTVEPPPAGRPHDRVASQARTQGTPLSARPKTMRDTGVG